MTLRDALASVGTVDYDRKGPRNQEVFSCLESVAAAIHGHVPNHYLVPVSRGVGGLPIGLWVSILDPDVTTSPTKGTYLVFLFNEARTSVSLSLNQGVTAATRQAQLEGIRAGDLLKREATAVRAAMGTEIRSFESEIKLGNSALLRKYESGNIAAKTWPLDQLPDEEALVNVLITFVDLYVETVAERDRLKMLGAGGVTLPAREVGVTSRVRERRFEPKDASDYRAHIGAQEHSRSRSHELLVKRLGEWAITRGFEPNTNVHPRDLVLHGDAVDLLVEVKVFAPGRPSQAVRECIGQLYEYRAFLGSPRDVLIAALSANPGLAYLELLQDMSICVIWPQQGGWCGTESAVNLGLADHF